MTSLATLGADELRGVMGRYRDALRAHQADINRLNVYPVPDGDTGTNMALTLEAVVAELDGVPAGSALPEVCRAIGHGSLMGARGNSGVILSQLLRGMCERMGGAGEAGVDGAILADALAHAADLARRAVVRPVEGTILTVASAAAEGAAAGAGRGGATLVGVVEEAHGTAADALARTPEMLAVLAQAGVVDAGGAGFLLLLDACWSIIDGAHLLPEPSEAPGGRSRGAGRRTNRRGRPRRGGPPLRGHVPPLRPGRLHGGLQGGVGRNRGLDRRRRRGRAVELPHPHRRHRGRGRGGRGRRAPPADPGDRSGRAGRGGALGPRSGERPEGGPVGHPVGPPPTTSVVAVVTGDGIGRIFRSLGVHHQVVGGQSMNPSTQDLLEAVELVSSDEVVILPNNKNIRPVAEQVDALTDKTVRVVATGSILEGFAALLAYDPAAGAGVNAASMGESAARVVPAEITRAVRDASTDAGEVHQGDWIGLSRDGVVSIADSAVLAMRLLLSRLLEERHELITLIEGEGSRVADTRKISEWLNEEHPEVALEVHHGGQPLYPYLLGIE